MEPLAIQSGVSQTVRPILALDGNLTAVLREGRTVAGEVLQTLDGKSVLIGVGRHRVPAESQVELAPGQRFLARVEHTDEGTVLKVLGRRGGPESRLLSALRGVVGDDLPVGELLGELASTLKRAVGAGEDGEGRLARLLKQLGEHVYVPGSTGQELKQLLARAGMDHEALLAQLAATRGGPPSAELAAQFAGELFSRLSAALGSAGITLDKETLARLRAGVEAAARGAGEGLGSDANAAALEEALRERLGRALAELPAAAREALLRELSGALRALFSGAKGGELVLAWLASLEGEADLRVLEQNLKARLLGTLERLEPGAQREAVQRTLAGLEAEQLLNVARKEFAEGWHLSLPIPDGDHLATAHLLYRDAPEHEGEDSERAGELQRVTLTVDFSRLGPLRAEFGVREDLVALRVVATRQDVAQALQAGEEELSELLAIGGREARVSVILGTPEDAAVDALNQNIRWLQEHHLMDLEG